MNVKRGKIYISEWTKFYLNSLGIANTFIFKFSSVRVVLMTYKETSSFIY